MKASGISCHDSYDFKISVTRGIAIWLVESRELDLAAERIFVGKIPASESLVYDHDEPGCAHVIFGEDPAMEQRHSESLKIVLADGFIRGFPAFHMRPAGNDDVRPVGFQRRLVFAFGGGEHTGDGLHAVEKPARD